MKNTSITGLARTAALAAAILLTIPLAGAYAQTGGIIQPGAGIPGDAFKMWKLRFRIVGNVSGSPSPEQAGARWRPIGCENWQKTDDEVLLPPGKYVIEFKGRVPNWIAPADREVALSGNRNETVVYRRRDQDPKTAIEPKRE